MAKQVVLDKHEVNTFTHNLSEYHIAMLKGIQNVHKKMVAMNKSGVFQMNHTSQNVEQLLETIETEIFPMLKECVLDTDQCANLLIQIMNGLDS